MRVSPPLARVPCACRQSRSNDRGVLRYRSDEKGRLITRISGHVPRTNADVQAWIRSFQRRTGKRSTDEAISIDLSDRNIDFLRHLDLIRSLCAGLAPVDPNHLVFLRRAKINPKAIGWSAGVKKTSQRVGLSRMIDIKAQRQASNDLKVIFAFDRSDVDLCSGWEKREFEFRKQIVIDRLRLEEVASAMEVQDGGRALAQLRRDWRTRRDARAVGRPGFS